MGNSSRSAADRVTRREAALLLDVAGPGDITARKRTKRGGKEIAFVFRYRATGISKWTKSGPRARETQRPTGCARRRRRHADKHTVGEQSSYSYVCMKIQRKGPPGEHGWQLDENRAFCCRGIRDADNGIGHNWKNSNKGEEKRPRRDCAEVVVDSRRSTRNLSHHYRVTNQPAKGQRRNKLV